METHSFPHRDYEIVVAHTLPYYQAAIYPTNRNLPFVDWETAPIRASNVMGAVELAKQRINKTFAILRIN